VFVGVQLEVGVKFFQRYHQAHGRDAENAEVVPGSARILRASVGHSRHAGSVRSQEQLLRELKGRMNLPLLITPVFVVVFIIGRVTYFGL